MNSILLIYDCLKHSEKRILHPVQISRETGIHSMTVLRILKSTPELFFKVPAARETEVGGYALTTATHARHEDDVEQFVRRRALLENCLYWGALGAIGVAFLFAILTMIPALGPR